MIEKDIERIYFSKEEIQKRVQELGAEISRDYADKDPILVGVLKGCFVFMADLTRCIDAYAEIDFMAVSTYGNGTTTTGAVNIRKDLSYDIENRHVIIIEDILDSGVTLSYLRNYLMNRKPA